MLKGEIFTHWGLTCLHKCVKQTTSTQVGFNKRHKLQNKLESNKETSQVRIILANIKWQCTKKTRQKQEEQQGKNNSKIRLCQNPEIWLTESKWRRGIREKGQNASSAPFVIKKASRCILGEINKRNILFYRPDAAPGGWFWGEGSKTSGRLRISPLILIRRVVRCRPTA